MSADDVATLDDIIRSLASDDPDITTKAVLDAVKCPARLRELFYPLVRNHCRWLGRADSRRIEHTRGQVDEETPTVERRTTFLTTSFYNGERYVAWGAASVADHEGRIAFQLSLRNGIDADICLHQQAIVLLASAGVSCLDEVPDFDPVSLKAVPA